LDTQLAKNKFVAGDFFSIADCASYPQLKNAPAFHIPIDYEKLVHLKRWMAMMEEREGVKKGFAAL